MGKFSRPDPAALEAVVQVPTSNPQREPQRGDLAGVHHGVDQARRKAQVRSRGLGVEPFLLRHGQRRYRRRRLVATASAPSGLGESATVERPRTNRPPVSQASPPSTLSGATGTSLLPGRGTGSDDRHVAGMRGQPPGKALRRRGSERPAGRPMAPRAFPVASFVAAPATALLDCSAIRTCGYPPGPATGTTLRPARSAVIGTGGSGLGRRDKHPTSAPVRGGETPTTGRYGRGQHKTLPSRESTNVSRPTPRYGICGRRYSRR